MTAASWAAVAVLALICLGLLWKLLLLRGGLKSLRRSLKEQLTEETNTGLDVSVRDRELMALADELNTQLKLLQELRHRYTSGNRELKSAITNLSHDLRTPLTAICGYLELLEREEDAKKRTEYLSILQERADLLRHLTQELFLYSTSLTEQKQLRSEQISVREVLEACIAADYQALCSARITPEIRLPEDRVLRALDRAALERIFSNLLSNARKYSRGDLRITLSADGTVVFSNAAPELNPVSVGKLFDRYYTVQTARDSTGLGLSIARNLAERMGGTITADLRNQTLTITLRFP